MVSDWDQDRRITLDKYNKNKEETNSSNTVSDALKEVHCKAVPVGSEDLYHISCAFDRCDIFPKFTSFLPTLEKFCEDYISFQTFNIVNYCSEHLSLPTGATICSICNTRDDGKMGGTVK